MVDVTGYDTLSTTEKGTVPFHGAWYTSHPWLQVLHQADESPSLDPKMYNVQFQKISGPNRPMEGQWRGGGGGGGIQEKWQSFSGHTSAKV